MTASATVSPSCSVGSCSFFTSCYSFHNNTQNWRPTSSPLPSASSTRFIVSLPHPKINQRGTTRACNNCFQSIFPRSGSETNGENEAIKSSSRNLGIVAAGLLAAVIVSGAAGAIEIDQAPQSQGQSEAEQELQSGETMENIPQTLSGECASEKDCKKPRIQRPKSRKAEFCTIKCVGTCIRGGGGSPGEGPFNIRRPLVVFKEGFRSRRYCLVECSDICNLIGDGDDGP